MKGMFFVSKMSKYTNTHDFTTFSRWQASADRTEWRGLTAFGHANGNDDDADDAKDGDEWNDNFTFQRDFRNKSLGVAFVQQPLAVGFDEGKYLT